MTLDSRSEQTMGRSQVGLQNQDLPTYAEKQKTNKHQNSLLVTTQYSPGRYSHSSHRALRNTHPLISSSKYDINLPCTSSFCASENDPFQYLDNTTTTDECSKGESSEVLVVGLSKPHRLIKIVLSQVNKVTFVPE